MIGIINYGSGNVQAIANIYKRLNIAAEVVSRTEQLSRAEHIVLPGVGAFDAVMIQLNNSGLREALDRAVLEDRKPTIGICVGMQVLAKSSEEGDLPGLGWIDAKVKKLDASLLTSKPYLPHLGWNQLEVVRNHPLLENVDPELGFYFLHSYYFSCNQTEDILTTTNYGGRFTSAVQSGNVFGTQFHPEKSHRNGIEVFRNFAKL
jgi:glutamine amidotransferase